MPISFQEQTFIFEGNLVAFDQLKIFESVNVVILRCLITVNDFILAITICPSGLRNTAKICLTLCLEKR